MNFGVFIFIYHPLNDLVEKNFIKTKLSNFDLSDSKVVCPQCLNFFFRQIITTSLKIDSNV
jgi:hypothetical protein